MTLAANTRLGPYEILGPLNSGGMGEVYRARDTQLEREVALKVLRSDLVGDSNAISRFQREAKLAGGLNHPHIISIYGVHEVDGLLCIAMELVDGEPFDRWQAAQRPDLARLLEVFTQIADALAAAHGAGIIHRDIKPSNILVNRQGYAKVLDFGLAKQVERTVDASQATTSVITGQADVIGTPAYMSPEQAQGAVVDARTDIFSLGVVLYEAVTGQRPFQGDSVIQLLHEVINKQPRSATAIKPALPAELEWVLERAMAKRPPDRYRAMADFAADLRRLRGKLDSGVQPVPVLRRRTAIAALAVLALAVAAFGVYWLKFRRAADAPTAGRLRFERLTDFNDSAIAPALSPDGRMLTFVRGGGFGSSAVREGQIYVKLLPGGEPVQLTNDRWAKHTPAFTPDGSRIVYSVISQSFVWDSWQVPVLGGQPSPFMPNASGVTWVNDRELLYAEIEGGKGVHMGIMVSSPNRVGQRLIYMPPGMDGMAHRAAVSPDKKWVLIVEMDGRGWTPCRLVPWDGSTAGRRVGPQGGQCTTAAWSPDGRWMYFSSDAGGAYHIWRQRFPDGEPEQLTFEPNEQEGTAVAPDGKSLITAVGTQQQAVYFHDEKGERQLTSQGQAMLPLLAPDNDTVYYLQQAGAARSYVSGELWRVSLQSGRREQVLPGFIITHYDLSPDGQQILFAGAEDQTGGLWITDSERRTAPRQLTKDGEYRAVFSGDGYIYYLSQGTEKFLYRMRADGSARQKVHETRIIWVYDVSPDGRWAAVGMEQPGSNGVRIALLRTEGNSEPFLICGDCVAGFGPGRRNAPFISWSADGKYIFLSLQYFGLQSRRTARVPFDTHGPRPMRLARTDDEFRALPGAKLIPQANVFSTGSATRYLTSQVRTYSNLFRVHLPE